MTSLNLNNPAADATNVRTIRQDPIMTVLLNKTPAEVYATVAAQLGDLSTAQERANLVDLVQRLAAATAYMLQRS